MLFLISVIGISISIYILVKAERRRYAQTD